jgi:heptose-I-phosphate ethanolaminephosphotransferase
MLDCDNGLVISHMMGSHRHYPNRYPEEYLEDKAFSEYEKSVHFSDKALGEMMAFFRKDKRVKAVVFVSDHSHIPADKRGHNADQYSQEMTEIPMFVYLSPAYQQENRELVMRLRKNRTAVFTNDLIFELMLSLWGIAPASRWNIGQNSYALDYTNARTLWGREKIRGRYTGIP